MSVDQSTLLAACAAHGLHTQVYAPVKKPLTLERAVHGLAGLSGTSHEAPPASLAVLCDGAEDLAAILSSPRLAAVGAVIVCGSSHLVPAAAVTQYLQHGVLVLVVDTSTAQLRGVLEAEIAAQHRRLHERVTIMQHLITAADADDPLSSLVAVMAQLSSGSAMIFDSAGTLLHSAGAGPVHLIRAQLLGAGLAEQAITIGRWHVISRSVRVRAQDYHVALASVDDDTVAHNAPIIFDTLRSLLGSFGAVEGFVRTQQKVSSVAVLRELELGISPGQEQRFWHRLEEFGFAAYTEVRFLIVKTFAGADFTRQDFERVISPVLPGGQPLPMLCIESARVGDWEPGLRMMIPAGPAAEAVFSRLDSHLVVGVSEAFAQLSSLPEIARATETALSLAVRNASLGSHAHPTVVRVDELAPAEWLLAAARSSRDRSVLANYGMRLRSKPELQDTLLSYFASHLNVSQAAARLNIHPNTLRYRLSRIEEELDISLSDPLVLTNLCLSFHDDLLLIH